MLANKILDVVNFIRTRDQEIVLLYFAWFVIRTTRNVPPTAMMMSDAWRVGRQLGWCFLIHYLGASIVGETVNYYRAVGVGGGPGSTSPDAIPGMMLGSMLMVLAAAMALRIMSINKFGNSLWVGMLAFDGAYLLWKFDVFRLVFGHLIA